jgi:hypothetical protein
LLLDRRTTLCAQFPMTISRAVLLTPTINTPRACPSVTKPPHLVQPQPTQHIIKSRLSNVVWPFAS